MKQVIGIILVFGTVAMFLWNNASRLMSEIWHARDFVPAQSYVITDYKCTNWNGFMFNECTVTFVSRQSGESREITDWRFGRAPRDPIQLLQRRDNASSVTTDVSLRTLWNRVFAALAVIGFVAVGAIGLIASALKDEDAPAGTPSSAPGQEPIQEPIREPSREPSRQLAMEPIGRSTFGKRRA